MRQAPSPHATAYQQWIDSLTPDELRTVEGLGLAKHDEPSYFCRTVEDFQVDRIEAPEADDADWNLRLDLLDAGAPAERLDDICEVIELHGETVAFRHATRALHARILPLMTTRDPKIHAIAHAFQLTLMTMSESAEICGCSKQNIRKHVLAIEKRLSAATL